MGKIRVKTLGDDTQEKKEKIEAKKRKEQKKLEQTAGDKLGTEEVKLSPPVVANEVKQSSEDRHSGDKQNADSRIEPQKDAGQASMTEKPAKKEKFKREKVKSRSKTYLEKSKLVDKNKVYSLDEALKILPTVNLAKFDETVELHMNTTGSVSGAVTLPHGTGKQVRVTVADGADVKAIEELVKKIEGGTLDFDVLIATPDAMPKLARVARVLGPRGLMPNPKNGTVTPKPDEAAKKFAGGQVNFKTEAKAPILHMVVGKMSFGDKNLTENIKVAIKTVDTKNVINVTLKSTMSPGLKIDFASL